MWEGDPDVASLKKLVNSHRHIRHASRVGEEWMRSSESAVSAESLAAELLTGIESDLGVEALQSELLHKHRGDFESGRTVDAHGWILSRTEVALYAFVSLSRS